MRVNFAAGRSFNDLSQYPVSMLVAYMCIYSMCIVYVYIVCVSCIIYVLIRIVYHVC